jgi:hypothetical protein
VVDACSRVCYVELKCLYICKYGLESSVLRSKEMVMDWDPCGGWMDGQISTLDPSL